MTDRIIAYQFMPQDEEAKKIMHQRAIALASASNEEKVSDAGIPYIKFRLGKKERYGIDFSVAQAVVQASNLKQPPCVSAMVSGVINYQGKLIGVVDLEKVFNINSAAKPFGELNNIIIVRATKMLVGVLVGEIEMSDYYQDDLLSDSILSDADRQQGFIRGIDKGRVAIINVEKILASIKLVEGEIS